MKLGVIVIFHNNEKDIDTQFFIEYLNQVKNIEFCLINNSSRDKTYELLNEIKESCDSQVSLLNMKNFKSVTAAVRSGAKFMSNQSNLNHIGYISTNLINTKTYNLNTLMKTINKKQNIILDHNIKVLEKIEAKQTLFQSIFSVVDYLEQIKHNQRDMYALL